MSLSRSLLTQLARFHLAVAQILKEIGVQTVDMAASSDQAARRGAS
jgi:hypothetical protein